MNPTLLNRPSVGISLSTDDYVKVKGLLPTPSYSDVLHGQDSHKTILIYEIDGHIKSPKQYKWLSDIKLGLKVFLFVSFEYVEEFFIHDDTVIHGGKYSLLQLHKAFKIEYRHYPSIYYPANKKSLYRHLVIHGKKLRHQQLFTMEAMTSTALMMNIVLKDKLQTKELHKKVRGAYKYILENQENFREKLTPSELKDAHRRGADLSHKIMAHRTEAIIFRALSNDKYFKSNGEINRSLLASDLNMNRKTIAKYLKAIAI